MTLKEEIRSESFIKSVGSGEMSPDNLLGVFQTTTKKLLSESLKSGYLLFPLRPREIDARQVMCEVLSSQEKYHMIECPIYSPAQKLLHRASFTDLSIFLRNGIIDIEFKKSPSDIKRDFPKMLSSKSLGCASFYFFNGKKIDKQLPLIKNRYKEAYEATLSSFNLPNMIKNKWYIFFLLAYEEKRIFYNLFDDIDRLDFSILQEKRV